MTKDGDAILWRGSGAGKPTGKGMGVAYRGAIYYDTASPKFAQLNAMCGIFEYQRDHLGVEVGPQDRRGESWTPTTEGAVPRLSGNGAPVGIEGCQA